MANKKSNKRVKIDTVAPIKFSKLKGLVESFENSPLTKGKNLEDFDISFEYIVGSLFPRVFKNIITSLKNEHTLGYIEGYKDGKAAQEKEN